ncbi:hypothetical protein NFI96_017435, partial [Prochilodus magdalenae]
MARLALFSFFCLVLEVRPQNLPRPELSVFPVVAQDGSVKLDCTARYERVDQCSFYHEEDKTNLKTSQTCQLSLTVSELMRWTGRGYSSPEQIKIICFYIGGGSGYSVTSADSRPAPVTIINAPRLSVSPAGRSPIQLNCTPPYSAGVSRCYFYTEGRERNVKGPSCDISLSPSELTTWANRSYSSPEPIRVTCYYAVRVSRSELLSPHSLPAPVRALELPPSPPPTTTTQWTTPKSTTVASSAVPTLPSKTTTALAPSTVSTLPSTTRAASLITHSQPGDHTQAVSRRDVIALNSNPNMEYSLINPVPTPSQASDPSGDRQGQSKDTQGKSVVSLERGLTLLELNLDLDLSAELILDPVVGSLLACWLEVE